LNTSEAIKYWREIVKRLNGIRPPDIY